MNKSVLGAVAALLLAPAFGFAADLPARMPAPAPYAAPLPVFTWTGFYVGLNGGYGTGHADYINNNDNWFAFKGGTYSNDVKGALFGGQVGYNYQIGNLVLGVEGSADWSGVKGSADYPQYSMSSPTKITDLYMASAKVGYAFDRFMVYAKGGWAGSNVDTSENYAPTKGAGRSFSNSAFQSGWQAGLGAEFAVTNNIGIGAEWTHVDFGSKSHSGADSGGTVTNLSGKVKEDVFLAKVNYRF